MFDARDIYVRKQKIEDFIGIVEVKALVSCSDLIYNSFIYIFLAVI